MESSCKKGQDSGTSGAPKPRTGTRSRTGCATCKTKKLKCDETKPSCRMCLKKGFTCPGYQPQLKWSTKHEPRKKERSGRPLESIRTSTTYHGVQIPQAPNTEAISTRDTPSTMPATFDSGHNAPEQLPQSSIWDEDPWGFAFGSSQAASAMQRCQLSSDIDESIPEAAYNRPQTGSMLSPVLRILNNDVPAYTQVPPSGVSDEDMTRATRYKPPGIPQQITDIKTLLIENWFHNICPMWSAFDSQANMNRAIALDTWTSSESVLLSLQSMSAWYMVPKLPHLKEVALTSTRNAIQALNRDILMTEIGANGEIVPAAVLLSLITLGTSRCWSDSKHLGFSLLRQTKKILTRFNKKSVTLSQSDQKILFFFNNSCFYWDMLCRAVGSDEPAIGPPWYCQESVDYTARFVPHPWTGISSTAQHLFAQVMTLCHRFNGRENRAHRVTTSSLCASLGDIEEARKLEQRLRLLKHPDLTDVLDPGDSLTPISHLFDVAEAYRLAALLQLYQTFQDLSPQATDMVHAFQPSPTNELALLSMARQILDILVRIPPNSGSRSIQPILYLSASTGLKFTSLGKESHSQAEEHHDPISLDFLDLSPTIVENKSSSNPIASESIDVAQTRELVMQRLDLLELSLPSRPIVVVKDLIKAIWTSYDDQPGSSHWICVMKVTGLYSIFG